jgi:cold shock CspA family protein
MDEKKEPQSLTIPETPPSLEKAAVPEIKPPSTPHHSVFSALNLPDDKFSKGRVMKYFPQSKYGFIKDRKGKDVYFNIDEVRFMGSRGREGLKEGILVGYDVAWTSHGLHISKIKIY